MQLDVDFITESVFDQIFYPLLGGVLQKHRQSRRQANILVCRQNSTASWLQDPLFVWCILSIQ